MNNKCRSCESAIYNTKGRNLFQKQNAKLLSNIDLVTGVLLKKDPKLSSYFCASCVEYVNRTVAFRERLIETQKLLQRPKESRSPQKDSDEKPTDADQTPPQDADSQIAALEEELRGRTDFNETDAHETAQVADLLMASLQKDLGYIEKGSDAENISESPKPSSSRPKNSASGSTPLTSSNVANVNPLPVAKKNTVECTYCDKFHGSKLTRHMRSHTGERPFKCQYCDRSFSTRGNTVRHESIHTRQAAFACPTCGMSFSHEFVLKKHINSYHNKAST